MASSKILDVKSSTASAQVTWKDSVSQSAELGWQLGSAKLQIKDHTGLTVLAILDVSLKYLPPNQNEVPKVIEILL